MKSAIRRTTIAVVAILLVSAASVFMPWGRQAFYLWKQQQLSCRVLPPDTVIYTEDPARIAGLRTRPDYRRKSGQATKGLPEAWERVPAADSFSALFGSATGQVANFQVEDTFGYLRTSTGGIRWIVMLSQVNSFAASGGQRKACLTQSAFKPAAWTRGDRAIEASFMSEQVLLKPADRFTIFAPQPDPDDAACVQVPYDLNGQTGALHATLTDQGYVQFRVHSGPALLVKWNAP